MDKEMFTFFPHGIRALIVDDDQKFLKSAKMMLDLLHFKVATCGSPRSPSSALRLLSDDGSLKDVDVVLADAHKVAASGFDLRAIVEPDLGIPVIYFMCTEGHTTPVEGDDSSTLFQIVQSATYIIKKPLDASELTGLWRVVAYRKCVLDARGVNARASSSAGRQDGSQPSSLPAGASPADDDGEEEAARVHYKVVTVGGRKKKQANSHSGAGGHPSKIQDRRNMEGQNVHQVASHSERNSAKHQKNKGTCNTFNRPLCLDGRRRHESLAVANPTVNTSPCNPQLFTERAGPSNIAGGSSSAVEQPSSFTAGAASNAVARAFTGNAALAPFPWPAGNFCGIMARVATPAEEQQSSVTNQNQASFPLLSFGPFPYQGPVPPPSGQDKIILDNPVGSLAPVSLNPCVAPPSESEIEALFASITDLPASENNVPTQDFHAAAAEAEQSEAAAMVAGLMDVPLDNDYLLGAGAAPAATDGDILFPLDEILWPGGLMHIDSGGFVDGASGFLDGMRDDMGSSGQGTEGFSFLDDTL